jgi:hypothetical protein
MSFEIISRKSKEKLKFLENNLIISAIIIVSVLLMVFLYYLKGSILNFGSFLINSMIILSTIFGIVISEGVFLLSIDSIVCRKVKFKEKFFYITKSLWLSQCILLPVVLCLILINFLINLNIFAINKIIVFVVSYLSQLILFFSYKFVTKRNWVTTIKIVASSCLLAFVLQILLKFI